MSQENYLNPFDDEQLIFTVLINDRGEYSLWPEFAPQPQGWRQCHGPASRVICLDYIERSWTSINPFRNAA